MPTMKNLEKYKDDLKQLLKTGGDLLQRMQLECAPEQYEKALRALPKERREIVKSYIDILPRFSKTYQAWYSEAKALVRQLLPDRSDDFSGYYEEPKGRKNLTYGSYRISDCLLQTCVPDRTGRGEVVGPSAAIPRFQQQLAIVEAVKRRFESSLLDIRQIVQADLFDSELEAAKALLKNGFLRPAGVLAGVIVEKHLAQVCKNHGLRTRKKRPTIADYNEMLKGAEVIGVPQWRFNQHLGDIRNLCGHKRDAEPTREQVNDLVDGAMRVTKTLF